MAAHMITSLTLLLFFASLGLAQQQPATYGPNQPRHPVRRGVICEVKDKNGNSLYSNPSLCVFGATCEPEPYSWMCNGHQFTISRCKDTQPTPLKHICSINGYQLFPNVPCDGPMYQITLNGEVVGIQYRSRPAGANGNPSAHGVHPKVAAGDLDLSSCTRIMPDQAANVVQQHVQQSSGNVQVPQLNSPSVQGKNTKPNPVPIQQSQPRTTYVKGPKHKGKAVKRTHKMTRTILG